VAQVYRLVRERVVGGEAAREVVYGVTSLTRAEADAGRLLGLIRGHWSVESRLFGVRDVTLGEDACRVRTGSAPQALAGLRNVVVCLLGGVKAPSKAAATRRLAAHPREAVALLNT
jgi:predicted transposase YbfD/YdcC